MTYMSTITRQCTCGMVALANGLPRVAGDGKRYAEHFADHSCIRWFPQNNRLLRLKRIATATGEQWDKMLHYKRAWEARCASAERAS